MDIIQKKFKDNLVLFQNNGYLNATEIAKSFGKLTKDYLKNQRTQEYIKALEDKLNTSRGNLLVEQNQLVIVKNCSPENGGGTWLHPKLAIDFARWLDPYFGVWCDEKIEEIIFSSLPQVRRTPKGIPVYDLTSITEIKRCTVDIREHLATIQLINTLIRDSRSPHYNMNGFLPILSHIEKSIYDLSKEIDVQAQEAKNRIKGR